MSNTRSSVRSAQQSPSHGKLIAVIVAAALVIILALLSAFVWPGWALNKTEASKPATSQQQTQEPTTPTIKATDLPDGATELLKAMPDSVLNFARTKADASTTWNSATPLEEYTLTYSTGKKGQDITLIVAQWSSSDDATTQYNALTGALDGKKIASGAVKVQGDNTGEYVVKTDKDQPKQGTAVWRNDTVVFQATGTKDELQRFYQKFPL
ncbi:hypothetical protein JS531_06165 [Bifidobacterium sp. CP2]|uniref:hypothetical protein n=1 Tax=Bifidobacterium TaxID=1678 RepID=UPI001BDC6207|nr:MULTISPECIES: hypothetical protein [Bifidobacterium]MBT1181553.1 hypothetical protein [Bifidobacterium sp. CP2]MBW3081072.1 hypothetical protein [Bifidobacterium saguinibicoloris]